MHLYRYCQLIKNFCIKPQEFNLEDMNAQIRQWFGTLRWFVQLLGGCFHQESDYPTFYHLAVLDYKPCYSQEPWLGRALTNFLGRVYSHTRNVVWMQATGHFWAIVTPTLRDPPSNCFFSSYTIIAIY